MDFKIRPINSNADIMKFIKCQWNFYKNDKNWVPPLISDRKKILNTKKNPFYNHSDIQLFLAETNNEIIGRIAAITNENHNVTHKDKVGFFGFFECINNQGLANALFDAAGNWLKEKGMDIMRGPENPSQNDDVGLLIDAFDSPPVIMMTYNPNYYLNLLENAGFHKAKDLYAYLLKIEDFVTEKLERMQSAIRERYKVTIRNVNFKDKKQFAEDVKTIKEIYNAAWEPNWGFVKMTSEEFDFLAEDLKMVADPNYAMIAYTNGKLAGFALAIPDINQALLHNKKGGLIGGLWHLMTKKKKIDLVRIIVLGVLPEFQKTGIDSVLYYEFLDRGKKSNIKYGEASWILEDNVMMNRALTMTMHAEIYKTYRLYEKQL